MVLANTSSRAPRGRLGNREGTGRRLLVLGAWHVTIVVIVGEAEISVSTVVATVASSTEKKRTNVHEWVRLFQLLSLLLLVLLMMEMRHSICGKLQRSGSRFERSFALVAERFGTVVCRGGVLLGASVGQFWKTARTLRCCIDWVDGWWTIVFVFVLVNDGWWSFVIWWFLSDETRRNRWKTKRLSTHGSHLWLGGYTR